MIALLRDSNGLTNVDLVDNCRYNFLIIAYIYLHSFAEKCSWVKNE